MGKRFKSALIIAACATVLLAAAGPLMALLLEPQLRLQTLSVWVAAFGIWTIVVLGSVIVYSDRRTTRLLAALRRELAAKNNMDVIAEVRDTRAKQSRHEFKQELLLDRIDASAATLLGDIDSLRAEEVVPKLTPIPWHGGEANGPKVLFITSNGSGMGHLSRCLAVASEAEKVGCRTAVLTLSTAYEVVRESGYPVMHHPSSAASPWSLPVWNRSFARFLHQRLINDRPDVVVFDGTAVYRGVTQTCRRLEIPLVWLRRGMWKEGVSRVQYDRPFEVADFVIVPGEVTGETVRDQDHVSYVSPVSLANRSEVLSADLAKQLLGLSREGKYALVQIGSAVLDGGPAVEGVIDCLNSIAPEITPVVLVSPVAKRQAKVSGAVVIHGRYPLAPFLRAFDFAVSSAGYNSVHENLAVGLPAVYIPNTSTVTDDQTARADLVAQSGLGIVTKSYQELYTGLRKMVQEGTQETIRENLSNLDVVDGSTAIVNELLDIIGDIREGVNHADRHNYK